MKGCMLYNSVYGWEDFASSGDRTRSARSIGQRLTHWATGAPERDTEGERERERECVCCGGGGGGSSKQRFYIGYLSEIN